MGYFYYKHAQIYLVKIEEPFLLFSNLFRFFGVDQNNFKTSFIKPWNQSIFEIKRPVIT